MSLILKFLKDKLFKLYANRDFITREDILNENLNISNEMFNKLDLDGDGKLTYSEYQLASNMKNEKIVYICIAIFEYEIFFLILYLFIE